MAVIAVAGRIASPVRHALVGAAGDHRRPEGLIADEREKSRIDNRSALRAAHPVFAVASRAIVVEDCLAVFCVAQIRAIWRQSDSNEISAAATNALRSGPPVS